MVAITGCLRFCQVEIIKLTFLDDIQITSGMQLRICFLAKTVAHNLLILTKTISKSPVWRHYTTRMGPGMEYPRRDLNTLRVAQGNFKNTLFGAGHYATYKRPGVKSPTGV